MSSAVPVAKSFRFSVAMLSNLFALKQTVKMNGRTLRVNRARIDFAPWLRVLVYSLLVGLAFQLWFQYPGSEVRSGISISLLFIFPMFMMLFTLQVTLSKDGTMDWRRRFALFTLTFLISIVPVFLLEYYGLRRPFPEYFWEKAISFVFFFGIPISLFYTPNYRPRILEVDPNAFNGAPAPEPKWKTAGRAITNVASDDEQVPNEVSKWVEMKRIMEADISETLCAGFSNNIVGQNKAMEAIRMSVLEHVLDNDQTPLSMLFCGPSGVGKTQLAQNFGGLLKLLGGILNMGEFKGGESTNGGSQAVDRLIGMPQGYQGCADGGMLTRLLKGNPNALIIFDEIEKADKGVFDVLLEALDRGVVKDGMGRKYDCSKAIFIFTTNVGRDIDPDLPEDKIRDKMVRSGFRPEFMGRISRLIPFRPLTAEVARGIATDRLKKEVARTFVSKDKKKTVAPEIEFRPESSAMDAMLAESGYKTYGARVIRKAVRKLVVRIKDELPENAKKVILYPARFPAPETSRKEIALPVGRVEETDIKSLREAVAKEVKAQDHALDVVIRQLDLRNMGLVAKPTQPEGTFLFTGPSGTGKTEMVEQIAKHLDREFLFFNMGNFENESKAQAFFGAPPGYIGSDKGGQLTQAVLDHPNAIILLDEIEKAHPKIWDGFLSVFDKGVVKDSSTGEEVPFSKSMIFMTSNLITEDVGEEGVRDYLRSTGYFRPEMVNRIEHIVAFKPLPDEVKVDIVWKVVSGIVNNFNEVNGANLEVEAELVHELARAADFAHGVRDIQRQAQQRLAEKVKAEGLMTF